MNDEPATGNTTRTAFTSARGQHVVFVAPEPAWIIDHYRVRRWYYTRRPEVGDRVLYLRDGYETRIATVNPFTISFEDGSHLRRPYLVTRLFAWTTPKIMTWFRTPNLNPLRVWRRTTPLPPDRATLYV